MKDDPTRRVGRPPVDDRDHLVPVSFGLQSKRLAELCAVAERRGLTLAEVLRRLVAPRLRK